MVSFLTNQKTMFYYISQVLNPESGCIFISEKISLELTQWFTIKSAGKSSAYLFLIVYIYNSFEIIIYPNFYRDQTGV